MRQVRDFSASIKFKTPFSDTHYPLRAFLVRQQPSGCPSIAGAGWPRRTGGDADPESYRPSNYFPTHVLLDRVACGCQQTQNQLQIRRGQGRDGGRGSGPHSLPEYGSATDANPGTDVISAHPRGPRVGGSPAGSPHRQRGVLTPHRSGSKDPVPFLLAPRVADAREAAHQRGRSRGGPPTAAPRRRWCRSARRWQRPLPESRSPWPQRCGTAQPPPPSR